MISSGDTDADRGAQSQDAQRAGDVPQEPPLQSVLHDVRALYAYGLHYVAAQVDAAGLRLRKVVLWTLVAMAAGVAALTAISAAVVMVLIGLAQVTGTALGGRDGAGLLIVGAGVLGVIVAVAVIGLGLWSRRRAQRTRMNYESRSANERSELGRDARQRAVRSHVAGGR